MAEDFLKSVLTSATLSTVTLGALAFLLREWITERLKSSLKRENDRDIENYKGLLARMHGATADGQKAAIEKRMNAFDRVWKNMLSLRETTSPYNFFYDIRTEAEWIDLPLDHEFQSKLGSLTDQLMISLLGDIGIEEERPYIGEVVWALFFAYRSFNLRLIYLARQSLLIPSSINWIVDGPTLGLLKSVLSPAELVQLDGLRISKVDFIRRSIENKVIAAWQKLISGEQFGEEALRHAHALLKVASRPL